MQCNAAHHHQEPKLTDYPLLGHCLKARVPQPLGLRDFRFVLAVWTRLELATPCVTGMYSNQLNYQTWSFDLHIRLLVCGGANIRLRLLMVTSGICFFCGECRRGDQSSSFEIELHQVPLCQDAEFQGSRWPFAGIENQFVGAWHEEP